MTDKEHADTRFARPARQTRRDLRDYSGICKIPAARLWLINRHDAAKVKRDAAGTKAERSRWQMELDRLAGEMRRGGMLGGEKR